MLAEDDGDGSHGRLLVQAVRDDAATGAMGHAKDKGIVGVEDGEPVCVEGVVNLSSEVLGAGVSGRGGARFRLRAQGVVGGLATPVMWFQMV
ncbi:hypothetical protein ACGFZ9_52470 [Streptomyces mirabilis]|uniref:hypothetical protein n=1 Tax=Streptomyces mirabilis TaxID=68239 RepID=UPI003719507D